MRRPGVQETLRIKVRGALADAGISQAEACRRLGVSTRHMNMMLVGHSTLTLEWAERILALCGQHIVITVRPVKGKHAHTRTPQTPE